MLTTCQAPISKRRFQLLPNCLLFPSFSAKTALPVFSARSDAARSAKPPASASTDDRARRRPPPMESAFDGLNAVPAARELRAKDSTVESNPPPPSASTDDRARRRPPPMESAFDGLDATPREGTAVPAALELRAKDSTVELVLDAGRPAEGRDSSGRERGKVVLASCCRS